RTMPENPIPFETYIFFKPQLDVAQSPILDRLAVKYFITSPEDSILGVQRLNTGDGSSVTVAPDRPFTVDLGAVGPIRGIGISPLRWVDDVQNPKWYVTVTVTNADTGAVVATGKRLTIGHE